MTKFIGFLERKWFSIAGISFFVLFGIGYFIINLNIPAVDAFWHLFVEVIMILLYLLSALSAIAIFWRKYGTGATGALLITTFVATGLPFIGMYKPIPTWLLFTTIWLMLSGVTAIVMAVAWPSFSALHIWRRFGKKRSRPFLAR